MGFSSPSWSCACHPSLLFPFPSSLLHLPQDYPSLGWTFFIHHKIPDLHLRDPVLRSQPHDNASSRARPQSESQQQNNIQTHSSFTQDLSSCGPSVLIANSHGQQRERSSDGNSKRYLRTPESSPNRTSPTTTGKVCHPNRACISSQSQKVLNVLRVSF